MAIEIRELVVRAVVAPADKVPTPPAEAGGERQQIVAECVEQVLDVLRLKKER